ncbi:MAG TPA: sigma-70 family RNA polymerase sigma factor [Ilumatobacteraceae bacterium]|nr:sigma-70 family RNA polymerase sigma factor [Ilumatobacteraceae bacterium]
MGFADVFRTEWPRLVATLMRDVGDLAIAEDAAQDAFVEASTRWPLDGIPDRPGAWLVTTGRRKAIDQIRRMRRFEDRLPALAADPSTAESGRTASSYADVDREQALDDQLALLVGCCHPALASEAQVALTLRIVAGLSTPQIARAFLVSEETMTRRLTRAKTKIRAANIPFDPPDMDTLAERTGAVCEVISSIFTEGHASATDTALIRGDLCEEAIWLAELLSRLVPTDPEVAGLHALLLLTDARRPSRLDSHGGPILLADQDRSLWDQPMIARGLAELARAHSFHRGGAFQFQAAIAALHATAPTFEATDWPAVLRLYDVLLQRQPSALVALNRAIAIDRVHGPAAAVVALDAILVADDLTGDVDDYVYFHTARSDVLARLGRLDDADAALRRAIECSTNESERSFLRRRRQDLNEVVDLRRPR